MAQTPRRPLPGSARSGPRGCCLIFHRAVAGADWAAMPNRSFHLDLSYLERLVRFVQKRGWDIVSLDEALLRLEQPSARRFVNFSLDDCYRDTAEQVVPLFQRLGAPITLFVTTGIPDQTFRLRNAGLETILRTADSVDDDDRHFPLATAAQRRAAYDAISTRWEQQDGDAAYLRFCARHRADPDQLDAQHAITWPMLQRLRDTNVVEIGAHTVSHRRISSLDETEALAEMAGSRSRLQDKLNLPVRHFAFPYGQLADRGPHGAALARRAGFASASTTNKGLARPGTDPFTLPRNNLNGTHRHLAFAQAHLSGLSGLVAAVLRRG